ncbi:hypothetical protein [Kutzneria kofuensis]|uniref:IrrE N-terminal-like domain-containing protein n=1 Tax=Kutzneria kofuensis TaxID=103725 RepID=A0A7W9KCY9_9PSEU|nr:hypothetical protein [Kutzneria kofuensis]MBB5890185.1 hypothetical protein [Kutzneria kofuensis]
MTDPAVRAPYHRCPPVHRLESPGDEADTVRNQRRLRAIADQYATSERFSVDALCRVISAQRGRPLHVHPLNVPPSSGLNACGMWIATDVADHVFVEHRTSRFHQEHIILHEIGHMLCEHVTEDLPPALTDALRAGDVDSGLVRQVLARTSYTTGQEKDAELVASLILERVARRHARALGDADSRLGTILGINDGD